MNKKRTLIYKEFIKAKSIYILGNAKSGKKVADYCLGKGKSVYISDHKALDKSQVCSKFKNNSLTLGQHSREFVNKSDILIKSASIPIDIDVINYAKSIGKPVYSITEFVLSTIHDCNIVILTGSNGKTTFSNVLSGIEKLKNKVYIISKDKGESIVDILNIKRKYEAIVIEISVDELKDSSHIYPDSIIITNLYEHSNHIREYGSFSNYIEAKLGWISNNNKELTIVTEEGLENHIFNDLNIKCYNKLNILTIDKDLDSKRKYFTYIKEILKFVKTDYCISMDDIEKIVESNTLNRLMKVNVNGFNLYFDKHSKNYEGVEWTRKTLSEIYLIITLNTKYSKYPINNMIFTTLDKLSTCIDDALNICEIRNIKNIIISPGKVFNEDEFIKVLKIIKLKDKYKINY